MDNIWHAKLQASLDGEASGQLRTAAIELLDEGAEQGELIASVRRLVEIEQAAGNDRSEEVLLELLDYFSGWCRSDLRI